MNKAHNADCLHAMREMPDNAFDLAVVDPPYGGANYTEMYRDKRGRFGGIFARYDIKANRTGGTWATKYRKKILHWDVAPDEEYFKQLFRVSKNQIIFGGNYFYLPPTRCFIVWRKSNIPLEGFSMAPVELAWTSFNTNSKLVEMVSNGKPGQDARFHPTQKPVDLYRWIFHHYSKPGDRILDTHLGSGSSRIAAYDVGLDFVGFEIDKEYFDKQEERFAAHIAQLSLFT